MALFYHLFTPSLMRGAVVCVITFEGYALWCFYLPIQIALVVKI